jgi:hypothetical protein
MMYLMAPGEAEVLIQVLVSKDLGKWVRKQAEEEGRTMSAYVRRLLTMQQEKQRVPGGIIPMASATRAWFMTDREHWSDFDLKRRSQPHSFVLERLGAEVDGTQKFVLHHPASTPQSHLPYTSTQLERSPLRQQLATGWFALDASEQRWSVVYSMADDTNKGRVVLYMRPSPP